MTEEPRGAIWPAVVVTDLEGRVTYWNAASEQLLGWAAADAIGRLISDLGLLESAPWPARGEILDRLRGGQSWQGQLSLRARDGRRLEVATVELPVLDGRGQLAGVLGMSLPQAGIAVQAEARAQVAADRLDRLQRISAALSRSLPLDGVSDVILAELVAEVGVSRRALWLVDGPGADGQLRLVRAVGSDAAADFTTVPLDSDLPAAVAVRTGSPVFIESNEDGRRLFPAVGDRTDRSYAALPLVVDGNGIGLLALGFDGDYRFDTDERRFLMAVADQAAQAFERARLMERESRAVSRLAFLAHASVVLAGSLDHGETLSRIVRLLVPSVADFVTVHLYDDRKVLQRAALAHRDPIVEANINRYTDRQGYEARSAERAAEAMRGRPLLLADAALLGHGMALDEEHGRVLASLAIKSVIAVPLAARGSKVGVLSLMRVGDSPPFEPEDREFAEEVGRRAAIAIDNARLHASRVADLRTLQQRLLPPKLPDVAHLELAAAYHPAAEGVEVGGDFYDVFGLADGTWAVTLGDVCGTGAVAAARTALVRHTVRAVTGAGLRSKAVVAAVNSALLADGISDAGDDGDGGERFCTLLYGEARVMATGVDLSLVCAGHPPPVVVHRDGRVAPVECRGSLVGVFDEVAADVVEVVLDPGDAIVFITDGIVEARSGHPLEGGTRGFFDDHRLFAALEEAAGGDAASIVTAVEKAVLTYSGGTLADDAAVLVLRSAPDLAR